MYTVYIHTNKENNKCYIGLTSRVAKKRWENGSGYKANKHFTSAVKKYGWDNFDHIIFAENLTKYEACKMERLLIALYDSTNPLYGYNMSIGGECGRKGIKHTEEARKRMSAAQKGRQISEETRRKIGEGNKGKIMSDEARRKISEALKGKHPTEETRRKLSESHKKPYKETYKKRCKPVLCVELNRIFPSIREAEKELNIENSNISEAANGKRKTAGGYHWEFIEGGNRYAGVGKMFELEAANKQN